MRRPLIQWLTIVIMITATCTHVMSEDGALLGMERFDDLKQIGNVVPKRSEEIKASPWGLQFNKLNIPTDLLDTFLESIAESGVKWARVETREYIIDHSEVNEKGYYRWAEFDRIIDGLNKRKIEIFVTINTDPYSGLDAEDKPQDKKKLSEWLEYVAAVVERYHDRIQYWEIDNEPKISKNYSEMVKAASKVIKKIDPNAKVIAGSMARVNVEGARLMLEDCGVGPYIDVITYHPYNEFPEAIKYNIEAAVVEGYSLLSNHAADIFKLVEKQDRPIAVWQGECGYPSSEYTTSWKGRGPWGEHIQAKWLLRRFLFDLSMDIPVNIYFLLREPPEQGKVNAKGLLFYGSWEPKVGYRAMQNLTSIFDETLMTPKTVTARFDIKDEGSFTGIKGENARVDEPFSGPKSPIPIQTIGIAGTAGDAVVYYIPWRMTEYVKPAKTDIRFKNISIDDPVVVDLMTGKIYEAETSKEGNDLIVKDIPLTDYPIAIVSSKSCKGLAVRYTMENCIKEFSMEDTQKTKKGWLYWHVPRNLSPGFNFKISNVGPQSANHGAHTHPEEEIFYILEGTARFSLNGETKIVGPKSTLFCPSGISHGISNAGDTELTYAVIKANYPREDKKE